jgi:hypothetical protein
LISNLKTGASVVVTWQMPLLFYIIGNPDIVWEEYEAFFEAGMPAF